jgi:hypothetical protein
VCEHTVPGDVKHCISYTAYLMQVPFLPFTGEETETQCWWGSPGENRETGTPKPRSCEIHFPLGSCLAVH